jgi:hypothetical protein
MFIVHQFCVAKFYASLKETTENGIRVAPAKTQKDFDNKLVFPIFL